MTGPAAFAQEQPDAPSDSSRTRVSVLPPDTASDTSGVAWSSTLPELRVRAIRSQAPAPSGARVQHIDSSAIARTGARSVAGVLADRSATFVKQYGTGGLSTLSLRGTSSTQTTVLLDGIRLSDPQTGTLDLSLVPTILLESVEVEHGASSARYGSGSLGGTVHLHTLTPSGAPTVRASARTGSFGERSGAGVVSGQSGAWSGLVAGRHYRTSGDFSYVNEALVPTQTVEREGADVETSTLYGRATWTGDRQTWSTALWTTRAERGLPGTANTASGGARQWDDLVRAWTEGRLPVGPGRLRIQVNGQASSLRFVNPPTGTDRTTRTRSADARATLALPFPSTRFLPDGSVDVGVTGGADRASLQDGVSQVRTAAFADARFSTDRLDVQPAVRLDVLRYDDTSVQAVSPRLGVAWTPVPAWSGVRLKGLVARAFRAPTFNERYYEPGGRRDLRPEDGWSAETGLALQKSPRLAGRPASFQAEVTGFWTRLTDQIVWRPSFVESGLIVWRPRNVARVRTRGLEATARARLQPSPASEVGGGVTFTQTRAEDRSNPNARSFGKQLAYVPEQQLKAWLDGEWRGFSLGVSAQLVGTRYVTSDASDGLAPYQVVNVRAGYERPVFGDTRVRLDVHLDNALDADYSIVRLYPMPPRSVSLRLTVNLTP